MVPGGAAPDRGSRAGIVRLASGSVMRDSSRQSDFRQPLLSNRDMMVRRGHHTAGPRGARDAPSGTVCDRARCRGVIARSVDVRPTSTPRGRSRPMSKSVAKAPIEPECRKRNVDIPRFFSRPIPPWSAFATDLDRSSLRPVPCASCVPLSRGFRPVWSSEPDRVARRAVGGPARFPVMALREDRSGRPIGCARGFPHDCAVVMATRSGAERNDPPRAPFSASDGSGPGSMRGLGQRHGRGRGSRAAPRGGLGRGPRPNGDARGSRGPIGAGRASARPVTRIAGFPPCGDARRRGRARDQDRRARSGEHRRPATTLVP